MIDKNGFMISLDPGSVAGEDGIITLMSKEDEEVDFVFIAMAENSSGKYVILQPVELLEGMAEDEALVFSVTHGADGNDRFEIVINDEMIDSIFADYEAYLDMIAKMPSES